MGYSGEKRGRLKIFLVLYYDSISLMEQFLKHYFHSDNAIYDGTHSQRMIREAFEVNHV